MEKTSLNLKNISNRKNSTTKNLKIDSILEKSKVLVNQAKDTMKLIRHFTRKGINPLDEVKYVKANSKIKDTEGQTFFEMKDVEVPADWSQLAIDILVSKYFRKAGVPGTGHEVSVRQVVKRIAHTLRHAGEKASLCG